MISLDIGCGRNKKHGFVGIDKSIHSNADRILDIETDPLPFDDETVDEIYTSHTLEHIDNIIFVMNEFWRVLKWGGSLTIIVPDLRCDLAWQDPTHKRYFNLESFKFFCGDYLIKHSLDYGIKSIFKQAYVRHFYPIALASKEIPHPNEYCTMIEALLTKNREHYDHRRDAFPFRIPKSFKGKKEKKIITEQTEDNHNSDFIEHLNRIVAKMTLEHYDKLIQIKRDATKRYGVNPAPLGLKGLFADIHRKTHRIKRWLWEGESFTSENIIDTLYDNAIYNILAAMEISENSILKPEEITYNDLDKRKPGIEDGDVDGEGDNRYDKPTPQVTGNNQFLGRHHIDSE